MMAASSKTVLKLYFETGDVPIESNFADLIDTIGGSPSTVVAASDASDLEKGRADYVCDGVSDEEEINAALSVADDVRLSSGVFELSNAITPFNATSKKVIGAGMNITILNFTPASSLDLITIGDSSLGNPNGFGRRHVFRDFSIVGQNLSARYGINMKYGASWNRFENIWIESFEHGVECTTDSSQNFFSYILTRDCTSRGFRIYGTANNFIHCEALRQTKGANDGFRIQGSGCNLVTCISDGFTIGFNFADYSEGCGISNIYSEGCDVGLRISGGSGTSPVGSSIFGGFILNSEDNTISAIDINRSQGTTISGVYVKNSTSDVSFSADANVLTCYLMNNTLSDGTPTDIDPSADVTIL